MEKVWCRPGDHGSAARIARAVDGVGGLVCLACAGGSVADRLACNARGAWPGYHRANIELVVLQVITVH